jgi:hypothetical protein
VATVPVARRCGGGAAHLARAAPDCGLGGAGVRPAGGGEPDRRLPDLVADGNTALLVPPGDAEALASLTIGTEAVPGSPGSTPVAEIVSDIFTMNERGWRSPHARCCSG